MANNVEDYPETNREHSETPRLPAYFIAGNEAPTANNQARRHDENLQFLIFHTDSLNINFPTEISEVLIPRIFLLVIQRRSIRSARSNILLRGRGATHHLQFCLLLLSNSFHLLLRPIPAFPFSKTGL